MEAMIRCPKCTMPLQLTQTEKLEIAQSLKLLTDRQLLDEALKDLEAFEKGADEVKEKLVALGAYILELETRPSECASDFEEALCRIRQKLTKLFPEVKP